MGGNHRTQAVDRNIFYTDFFQFIGKLFRVIFAIAVHDSGRHENLPRDSLDNLIDGIDDNLGTGGGDG